MPNIADLVMNTPHSQPEKEKLFLPSDISLAHHVTYAIEHLVSEEIALREGEAHDALESVRQATKYVTCLRKDKQKHAVGQTMNLRAGDIVREAEDKQRKGVGKYKRARRAMLALGQSEGYMSEAFPDLKPEDLYMKDPSE